MRWQWSLKLKLVSILILTKIFPTVNKTWYLKTQQIACLPGWSILSYYTPRGLCRVVGCGKGLKENLQACANLEPSVLTVFCSFFNMILWSWTRDQACLQNHILIFTTLSWCFAYVSTDYVLSAHWSLIHLLILLFGKVI